MGSATQITGLPPGAVLRPMPGAGDASATIEGLPAGAVLRPIGNSPPPLDDNPAKQGTYAMWDTAGNRLQIPYGNVPQAQQQGYRFDTNKDPSGMLPARRYAKDWAADPNAPHHLAWYGFTPGNVLSNVATGVKQLGEGAAQAASDIGGAILPEALGGENGNQPVENLGIVRHVVQPMQAEAARAHEDFSGGDVAAGLQHAAASGVPVIGPWYSDLTDQAAEGDIGGALARGGTQMLAPKVADAGLGLAGRIAETVESPLGDVVVKPRGSVPAEAASPAELKAYADEHGIPLNAAQATEHNLPRNLQSAGERATIGGTQVKQQIQAGQAAVAAHAQQLMDQFSPDTPDAGAAGEKIQQGIAEALKKQKADAEAAYADIDKDANGVKVWMKPLKIEAAKLLNDSNFVRQNVSSLDPKRAATVVRSIQSLPDTATFTEAQQLRSALLDEARHPDNVISQLGQGWIKRLTEATDEQMANAAISSPALMEKFRAANSQWEGMQEAFNNPRSPLYQALQEPDPNKVPQKFMTKGQIGGSPYAAELLDKYGIDKAPIKWALMGDMMSKDFGLYNGGKTLAGYSDPFLQSIFKPEELSSIYKTGAIARSLKMNTNPSGTAAVEGAMSDVQRPLRSALPKTAAAALTKAEWFNRWLMRNPAPPSSNLTAYGNWLNARMGALREAAARSGAPLSAAGAASEKDH